MASTSSSGALEVETDGWEGLEFDFLDEITKEEDLEEEEASTSAEARVQTATGQKLPPPIIRIDRSRCVECLGPPHLTCKECNYITMLCKKCARRAHHPHVLKTFRKTDATLAQLNRHLTLVYYNHIVTCERDICLPTCIEQRPMRRHFDQCTERPALLKDLIVNGEVKLDGTGFRTECYVCGLFITCTFLHANDCKVEDCKVTWCNEMRETFNMQSRQCWVISNIMKKKVKDVLTAEWAKVRERQRERQVEELVENLTSMTMETHRI